MKRLIVGYLVVCSAIPLLAQDVIKCVALTPKLQPIWLTVMNHRQFSVASDSATVATLLTQLHQTAKTHLEHLELPEKRITRFASFLLECASEMTSNARKYGNHGDPTKRITVRMSWDDNKITLEIADEGGAFFDPKDPSHPVQAQGLRAITIEDSFENRDALEERRRQAQHDPSRPDGDGGRGILLLEGMTDALVYAPEVRDGAVVGTRVTATWTMAGIRGE